MKNSRKRLKKQAEQMSKVMLAFALLSPQSLIPEWSQAGTAMAATVENIGVVSDTSSLKAVQSSKVKVEMNSDGKYRIVLLPSTNVFYGGDTGNVSTIIDHHGTAINFKSLPLNYYRINNNVIEMSRQKDNVEYILRVSIVNATSQGGYMKVELEAINRSGSALNLGGAFYWDTMVNGNDASPFEVIQNGWRNYSGGVQVTAFYANTYNVVNADRVFMGQYQSPDSAQLTGGSAPSAYTPGQIVNASDTAAQFWWDARSTANQGSRKFSTIVGIGPQNVPPSFTLTAPASGQTYYKGEQLQISGTTRDNDAGDLLTVKWSIDGGPENVLTQITATGSNQAFNTSYTLPDTLPDGSHFLQVWVMDDKGGVSSAGTVNFLVRSFVVPGTPTYTLVNNNNVTVNWDKRVNDASVTYELKNMTTNQTYDTGTSNTRELTGLTPNTSYSFAVRAKNSSGAYTGYSATSSKYTLANPPADVAASQIGNNVTASWTTNGNPVGTRYKTEIRNVNGQVLQSSTTTSTSMTTALTGLEDGRYELHVVALNAEGIQTAFVLAGQIMKDTTGPSAPSITLTPSTWTKEEVLVTVEAGTDQWSGTQKTEVKIGLTGEWREYTGPFTMNDEGSITITVRSVDAFGNLGQESRVTARVDRTAPTPPLISLNPAEWTKESVVVTLTEGADDASGIALTQYKVGESAQWIDYKTPFILKDEGVTVIYARSIDRASNVSALTSTVARIDKTAPEQPVIQLSEADWTREDVSFVITSGTDEGSGTSKTQYRLTEHGPWLDYLGEVTIKDEGETVVYARTFDRVGNVSMLAQATARIDKTAPTEPEISLSQPGWSKEAVQFTIAGSVDDREITYEYRLENEPYTTGNKGTVNTDGATVIYARAKDAVGNVSREVSRTVYVDKTLPNISFTPDGAAWTDENITATVQFVDSHSGIDGTQRFYQITAQAEAQGDWLEAESDQQSISISSEGTWYIHAKAADRAGNTVQVTSSPYRIQRKPNPPTQVQWSAVGETSVTLTADLPSGETYTSGYQYEIKNRTTGQSWTLQYPNNSLVNDTLSGGRVYEYEVRARNHTGVSEPAMMSVLTLPPSPTEVRIQKVDAEPSLAKVDFDHVQGATAYRVTATDSNGRIVFEQTISDPESLPYISNLAPGMVHTISVTPMNASGAGASCVAAFMSLPAAPGEFAAVQIREHDISMTWESVTSATYYALARNGDMIYEGGGLSYKDAGLESGTDYSYTVVAENETGSGPYASLPLLRTLPAQVTGLHVTDASHSSLHLNWETVRGAEAYEVWSNGEKVGEITADKNAWTLTNLNPGSAYQLQVRAVNRAGHGMSSSITGLTIPKSPTGLHVVRATEQGATLSWEAVAGADKYRVTIDGQTYEMSGTELTVKNLSGSNLYTYEVQAGNAAGYSEGVTSTVLTLPRRPEGLQVSLTEETQIGIRWQAVPTAEMYIVMINGAETGRTSDLEYRAEGLLPGQEYTLQVQAVNAAGAGAQAELVRLSKPRRPTNITMQPDVHVTRLSWSAVPGASEYVILQEDKEVYRGMDTDAVITGLEAGRWHHYRLFAVNRQSSRSEAAEVSFLTLPIKPEKVDVRDVTENGLSLDFTDTGVRGADQYIIERNGREVARMEASETQFVEEHLKPGTMYTYVIRAVNASGTGAPLTIRTMTQTLPLTTDTIEVISRTYSQDISWEAVTGAVAYEIRNQATGEVTSVSEPHAHLVSMEDGTLYRLEIVAVNEQGQRSKPVQIETLTKPLAPQTASVEQFTDRSVKLDLSEISVRGVEQFIIRRDGVEIARISANQTDQKQFEDSGLVPGERYTYSIHTFNTAGESETGFNLDVRTLPAAVDEVLSAQEVEEEDAVLVWPKVQGAEGYIVLINNEEVTRLDDANTTEFRLTNLSSADVYDKIKVIPINSAGEGAAILVAPFYTLPHIDSLDMRVFPESDHIKLEWDFSYPNETFVIVLDGVERYRGRNQEYVVDGLEAGKQYQLEVYTENGEQTASDKRSYSLLTKPGFPIKVAYKATKDQVHLLLEETRAAGAEQFSIERNGLEIARISAKETRYEDTDLEPGTRYNYVIRAINASGTSDDGFMLQAVTLPGQLNVPPIVQDRSVSGATLVWELVPGAEGYRIYQNKEVVGTTAETSLQITGLTSAAKYDDFSIIPYNEAGEGEGMKVLEFETLPSLLESITATAKGPDRILLTWRLETQNEIVVVAYKDQEIYRGQEREYVWKGLDAERHYEISAWTENTAGEASEKKSAAAVTISVPVVSSNGGSAGNNTSTTNSKDQDENSKNKDEEQNKDTTNTQSGGITSRRVAFLDIDQTFNKDQITWLAEHNIIQGVSSTRYEPHRPITRAEFTALIVRLMRLDISLKPSHVFQDVNDTDWFAPEINTAAERDVVQGMGNGKFAPHALVTREQASKIIANVVHQIRSEPITSHKTFTDQVDVSNWAREEVAELAGIYMINGYEDGSFRPLQALSRAEAAALIFRLNKLMQVIASDADSL
ncbi:fibronectin type III domain-containing protein [Paenibacillus sp. FSL R7-0272]|uniref:fibronectin type III domain-containing protein n=1 Tax=Paenibacillus sp. FSL R7-0272 TaxID=2921679 RepID=UPI0030EC8A86